MGPKLGGIPAAGVRPSNDDDANTFARSKRQIRHWPKEPILIEGINRPHEVQDNTSLPMRPVNPDQRDLAGRTLACTAGSVPLRACDCHFLLIVCVAQFMSAQRARSPAAAHTLLRPSGAARCWAAGSRVSREAKSRSHCRCASVSGTSRPRDSLIVRRAVGTS